MCVCVGAHGLEFICFLCAEASFNSSIVSLPVHVFLACTGNLQKFFILDFKLSIWSKSLKILAVCLWVKQLQECFKSEQCHVMWDIHWVIAIATCIINKYKLIVHSRCHNACLQNSILYRIFTCFFQLELRYCLCWHSGLCVHRHIISGIYESMWGQLLARVCWTHWAVNQWSFTLHFVIWFVQGVVEIVKHFKIFIIYFSARVSLPTGVRTEVVTSEVSRQGVLGS